MKLNGWQRLWVVVGVLWGLVVAVFAFNTRPQQYQYTSISSYLEFSDVYEMIQAPRAPGLPPLTDRQLMMLFDSPITDLTLLEPTELERLDGLTAHLEEAGGTGSDVSARQELSRKRQEDELRARTAAAAGRAFGVWLAVLLATYVVGWSAGWVWRGFRRA